MFKLIENFDVHNSEMQPYSVQNERYSRYVHNFGYIKDGAYVINCNAGKHYFKMPYIKDFDISLDVRFDRPLKYYSACTVNFSYDRIERKGLCVRVMYEPAKEMIELRLSRINGEEIQSIDTHIFNHEGFEMGKYYPLKVSVKGDKCRVDFYEQTHEFTLPERSAGLVGILKDIGIGEMLVKNVCIESDETPEKENVFEKQFLAPGYDTDGHPYNLDIKANKYQNGLYEIEFDMYGGVEHTKPKLDPKVDSWPVRNEKLIDPYIRFIGDCESEKLFIKNGELTFVDLISPNSAQMKEFMNGFEAGTRENPFKRYYYTYHLDDIKYFVFGYEYIRNFHNASLGDRSEFVFDMDEKLVYYGRPLSDTVSVAVRSSEDKALAKEVEALDFARLDKMPSETAERLEFDYYAKAVEHIKGNHYFLNTETPQFNIAINHRLEGKNFNFKLYLADAFHNKLSVLKPKNVSSKANEFGTTTVSIDVSLKKLPQNVYHIITECYRGEKQVFCHHSAFEVIDRSGSLSPQESAGLPMIHTTDGSDSAELQWSIKPDNNLVHYTNLIFVTPPLCEIIEPWKLLKLYNRKIATWLTKRGAADPSYQNFEKTIKNIDYLNYKFPKIEDSPFYYRMDLFADRLYVSNWVRETYDEFARLNPQYKLEPLPEKIYSKAFLARFNCCFDEWTHFINAKMAEAFREQWAEVKKCNPDIKRFSYGPFNPYAANVIGAEAVKWFGFENKDLGEFFDGFLQFEDYPFVCSYPTSYSAWTMATVKTLSPDVRISPEMYDSFEAGCPDGWVAYANPPLSVSNQRPWHTITQAYEYLFNSVYFREGKFKYWNDEAFMMYKPYNFEPRERWNMFVESWYKFLQNKPLKPAGKTVAFLYRPHESDDKFELEKDTFYNACEAGMYYIYDALRQSGLPAGFLTESLDGITEKKVDMLVLLSTRSMTRAEIDKVRTLHKKGVKLFAVSEVEGLEDIFGVKREEKRATPRFLISDTKRENVFPKEAEFKYVANGARELIKTDVEGVAMLFANDGAALFNASLSSVGMDTFLKIVIEGAQVNISEVIKEETEGLLKAMVSPEVTAEDKCGVNLFVTEKGETALLLTDYTPYNSKADKTVTVKLKKAVKSVSCISDDTRKMTFIYEGKKIKGFEIDIKARESLLLKLK